MRNLRDVFAGDSTRPVGVVLALVAVVTGLQLLLWPDPLRSSPVLLAMRDLAPAWSWALLFLGCGVLEVTAIASDRLQWRRIAAFVLACLWGFLCGAAWSVAPHTIAPAQWSVLAVASMWLFLRVSVQKRNGHAQ